ncbi:MAG: hypothetical protein QXO75_00255 [Nitrososphaerota archaeon]
MHYKKAIFGEPWKKLKLRTSIEIIKFQRMWLDIFYAQLDTSTSSADSWKRVEKSLYRFSEGDVCNYVQNFRHN